MDTTTKTAKATNKSHPHTILAMCLGACCLLMGLALIGAYVKDTHLKDVAWLWAAFTNNNYHVDSQPTTGIPNLPQPSTPVETVAYAAPSQPQMVFQASHEPVPQQKIVYVAQRPEPVPETTIIYVEQPRPEPVPDTTIVIYKPEVRQPVQKIVVIDERFERLKAEHEARMKDWTSQVVVVK
mgnify:CR=1 FL=1